MNDIAVAVRGLSKSYIIAHNSAKHTTLTEAIAHRVKTPFQRQEKETFWALKDIEFDVKKGDVVGIIGRNGAGKSTLLKVLSQITEPTSGEVRLYGRVGSLLEVGTGFHPELTGRENIYLNGAILGMRKREIDRQFDEIVDFAEVEQFLDTPVKRYSSGMYVRLAFAVAAHLNPEILVVDEVLSVGDTQFQKKCIGKMQDVANSGRTVLFVSHNMAVIQQLCEYGLFLEQGKVKAQATVGEIVSQYSAVGNVSRMGSFNAQNRSGSGWARVKSIKIVDQQNQEIDFVTNDADLIFQIELSVSETGKADKLRGLLFEIMFYTDTGDPVTSVTNVDSPRLDLPNKDSCQIQMRLSGPTFVPGRYRINTFLGFPFKEHVDEVFDALVFDILPPVIPWRPYDLHAIRGTVCRKAEWTYI